MNNGLFGFPPGKKITVDVQEFEADGIWYKPANAKFCFIEGSGGGQAGGAGTTTTHGSSGAAGVAFQVIEMASKFNQQEVVDIGAGSTSFSTAGGNTTFSNITWSGGVGAGACRNGYIGQNSSSQLSGGFGAGATTAGVAGRHGNFGAGGGGTGGSNTGTDGSAGGKPRTFQFAGSSAVTAETGGGAAGGLYALSVQNGFDANPLNDRHGFGEGGGGGAGNNAGGGARGGAGRRGSGGGGGGSGSVAGGQGGRGGDGFLRIQTYCWE